jgi:hypothetical protein
MAFIGNTVQTQGFTPAIDYFNGNGVTVTFTLSRPVASVAQMIVAIDNVIQNPSSAFNVSGNSITFTSAPLSGTNNIWVEYTSLITTYQGISQDPSVIGDITATGGYLSTGDFGNSFIDGTLVDYVTGRGRVTVGELDDITFYHGGTAGRSSMMDLYYAGGAKIYGTTALTLPSGTTGERPTGAAGMIRYNTTLNSMEYYNSALSSWAQFGQVSASSVTYLVVAGGGGGGKKGGGGGAGGYQTSTLSVASGTALTVTVGAGGAGATTTSRGVSGSNSVFSSVTSIGGGGGGSDFGSELNGASGGSGGGAAGGGYGTGSGGSGTSGQGNAGASNIPSSPYNGGGGGGAGAAGSTNGNGGTGTASSISGSSVTYAGGGGGGGDSGNGTGGTGGGGAGGNNGVGTAGTANTGGGGGGGGSSNNGAAGGSGIVIISYSNAYKLATATGTYTQTTSGSNYVFTFTGSGTITF